MLRSSFCLATRKLGAKVTTLSTKRTVATSAGSLVGNAALLLLTGGAVGGVLAYSAMRAPPLLNAPLLLLTGGAVGGVLAYSAMKLGAVGNELQTSSESKKADSTAELIRAIQNNIDEEERKRNKHLPPCGFGVEHRWPGESIERFILTKSSWPEKVTVEFRPGGYKKNVNNETTSNELNFSLKIAKWGGRELEVPIYLMEKKEGEHTEYSFRVRPYYPLYVSRWWNDRTDFYLSSEAKERLVDYLGEHYITPEFCKALANFAANPSGRNGVEHKLSQFKAFVKLI